MLFLEFAAVPNDGKNVDQMPSATDPVVGKRRASLDCKQQSKQLKRCRQLHAPMFSKEGLTTCFDAATNSLPTEGVISAADLRLDSQATGADRRLLITKTAAVSADSTTGEVLDVKCASELLRSCSDRGARQQPDNISGPKVCRRRKQELKVLRVPPEMDDCDQLNFDEEEATPTDGSNAGDTEPGNSLVGDKVFWMEMPESDEPTLTSTDDEGDIGSLLFVPSKTSNCQHQNVLWTAPVRDRLSSPAAFDASLPVSPFGFESGLAATDFDGVHDGRAPVPTASDGSFFNVHSRPRWLSDCHGGGCFSTGDDKLDSQVFCNLLSEELANMYDEESDPDFTDGLFSFSHCL